MGINLKSSLNLYVILVESGHKVNVSLNGVPEMESSVWHSYVYRSIELKQDASKGLWAKLNDSFNANGRVLSETERSNWRQMK
jgi:hypothetical protein